MADESMSIGEYLRRTRLARGLDISDISQSLHIRRDYLEAIEHDDWDKLPGEVYGIGFLRSYARHLDVDADALVSYRRRQSGQEALTPPHPAEPEPPVIRRRSQRLRVPTPPMAGEPAARLRKSQTARTQTAPGSGRVVLGAAIVLAALFVVGIFMLHNNPHPVGTASPTTRRSASPAPRSVSKKSSTHASGPTSHSAAVVTLASNNPAAGDLVYHVTNGPVDVTLSFTGLCWVEVWENGVSQGTAGVTYHAGQSLTVSASSSVEVWTGTRAYRMSVDNQVISLPDPSQRVVHVTVQRS